MNIAVYSDKFSGTLSATEVLEIIKNVFDENSIEASYFPVTDGGENSSLIFKEHGFKVNNNLSVLDLGGNEVNVELININEDIFFESSQLVGINNTDTDTKELNTSCLSDVLQLCDVIGLGGSRTNDGGFGLLSKMGINFYNNKKLIENLNPNNFDQITHVELTDSFKKLNKKILVDTFIPLLGNTSALKIFGPQKGLNDQEIKEITFQIERVSNLISKNFEIKPDATKPGTGAAGGLGYALSEVLGCDLVSGAEYFFQNSGLELKINTFDISILCEGKFDSSSVKGKVIGHILEKNNAKSYFLGGIYDHIDRELFTNIFDCGEKGLENPKKELVSATNKLVNEITI